MKRARRRAAHFPLMKPGVQDDPSLLVMLSPQHRKSEAGDAISERARDVARGQSCALQSC